MRLSTFIIYVGILVFLVIPASASNYFIEQIYTTQGSGSLALGINNKGQIIGSSGTSSGDTGAFFWSSEAGYIDIWASTSLQISPVAINDSGLVVGDVVGSLTAQVALWNSANGTISPVDMKQSYAINSAGLVLGKSNNNDLILWNSNNHSTTTIAPTSIGNFGCGSLNNSGQAVITTLWSECGPDWSIAGTTAYRWDSPNNIVKLDSPFDENEGYVNAINDYGYAVGESGNHAVMWKPDGSVVDLGIGYACDINNCGQIVGSLGRNAVMWKPDGSIVELPEFTGSDGSWAAAINDKGWIVGKCGADAVLWQPVPEPSSLLTLIGGLTGLGGIAWRRRR